MIHSFIIRIYLNVSPSFLLTISYDQPPVHNFTLEVHNMFMISRLGQPQREEKMPV